MMAAVPPPDRARAPAAAAALCFLIRVQSIKDSEDVAAFVTRVETSQLDRTPFIQEFMRRARAAGLQSALLEIGAEKLGTPPTNVIVHVRGIFDLDELRRIIRRLDHLSSWQELFAR